MLRAIAKYYCQKIYNTAYSLHDYQKLHTKLTQKTCRV